MVKAGGIPAFNMKTPLTLVTLTVLAFDFSFSNPDSDRDNHPMDNPWESLYIGPDSGQESGRVGHVQDTWLEGGDEESPGYDTGNFDPAVVVGKGHDRYDASNLDTYSVQDKEHKQRHRPRHGSNQRRRQERDQNSVSENLAMTQENSGTSESTVTGSPNTGTGSSCEHCQVLEANKQYRLDQIRKEILAKLRLERPPNITDKRLPQIPEIKDWLSKVAEPPHKSSVNHDPDEPTVRIISMLNLAQTPPPHKKLPNMENVCYFEFQPDIEPSDIISAKLGVFLKPVKYDTQIVTMFLIYKVKPRRRGNVLIKRKRIKLNSEDTNKWYRFNVESVVKNWVRNSDNNYGLQIMIYDNEGESLAIVEPTNSTEKLFKPYIEVEIREKSNSRERRMTGLDCHEEDSETRCCRYPLVVDFESYGWDWIIQPKRYPAYYCAGECTFAFLMSSAYGHLLQQSSNKGSGPCCTPRKMSPISMLYYDQDFNIVYGTLPSMVVDRCGCT